MGRFCPAPFLSFSANPNDVQELLYVAGLLSTQTIVRGDSYDHCQNNPERVSGKTAGSYTDSAFAD
jgi:hypothetical protein